MHHGGTSSAVALVGPLAFGVGVATAGVAAFHGRRVLLAAVRGQTALLPVEAGHVLLGGGMAATFVFPRTATGTPFVWLYLAAALVFLGFAVGHPRCCEAPFWSCYSMLAVEAFAMASAVATAHGWTDHLTALFVVFFSGTAVAAAGRLVLRSRSVPSLAGGGSLTPAATQVVMSGTMLLMFL